MLNYKVLYLVCVITLSPLFYGCFDDCGDLSGHAGDFEISYDSISTTAILATVPEIKAIKANDTIFKNELEINVKLHFTQTKIAQNDPLSFSLFSAAYACDPRPSDYINSDSISNITIEMITENENKAAVTSKFNVYSISNRLNKQLQKVESIVEDINSHRYLVSHFKVKLVDFSDIPSRAAFKITITSKSGRKLVADTSGINFHET